MKCQYLHSDCSNNATKLITYTYILDNDKTKINLCSDHAKEEVGMHHDHKLYPGGYTIDSKDL